MKLSKLIEVFPALNALSQTKLPAKVGYRVAKAINAVKPELETYEQQRVKLAQSLGTLSDDGMQFKFEPAASKEFTDQLAAMLEEEVEINLMTITPDELGNTEIEPTYLAALDGFFIKQADE